MKIYIILLAALTFSCTEKTENSNTSVDQKDTAAAITDTILGSRNITNEIAGSNYRKRAKGYFVITGKDTSGFMPIFEELTEEGKVRLNLHFEKTKSYGEQYRELKRILPVAAKDFSFDSLQSVSIGRLISSGDLDAEISRQLNEHPELIQREMNYGKISSFLKDSPLGEDFNKLFNPFGLTVDGISVEKVFMTGRKSLYSMAKMESDSLLVPEKILDCQTWIHLKKKY